MMNTPKIDDQKLVFKEDGDIAMAADDWRGKMLQRTVFGSLGVIAYSGVFFSKSNGNIWISIGGGIGFILLMISITYAQIFGKVQDFRKIAIEVVFSSEDVVIKTMPFQVGPVKGKPFEIRLNRKDVSVYKLINPSPDLFTLKKFVIRLKYGANDDVYIIPEYFPDGLETELRKPNITPGNEQNISS